MKPASTRPPTPIFVLFDGCCPLCHGAVRFALRRDPARRVRVAPLESATARALVSAQVLDDHGTDSVVVVEDPGGPSERVTVRSDAVVVVAGALSRPWRWLTVARWIPCPLRDVVYDLVARRRRTLWGRYASCPALPADLRDRLIQDLHPSR